MLRGGKMKKKIWEEEKKEEDFWGRDCAECRKRKIEEEQRAFADEIEEEIESSGDDL
jgi:hypothetical protein